MCCYDISWIAIVKYLYGSKYVTFGIKTIHTRVFNFQPIIESCQTKLNKTVLALVSGRSGYVNRFCRKSLLIIP